MFEEAERASEALRSAADRVCATLIPALAGCVDCGTAHVIAGPVLGICETCGAAMTVLSADETTQTGA